MLPIKAGIDGLSLKSTLSGEVAVDVLKRLAVLIESVGRQTPSVLPDVGKHLVNEAMSVASEEKSRNSK